MRWSAEPSRAESRDETRRDELENGDEIRSLRTLKRVRFGELLGVLIELFAVGREFLRELRAERVLGLRLVDQSDKRLDHLICLRRRLPVLRRDDR